jgi:CheY-like chemotaxis protein
LQKALRNLPIVKSGKGPFNQSKILVVDDEPFITLALKNLLKNCNFADFESKLLVAHSGKQALKLLQENMLKESDGSF